MASPATWNKHRPASSYSSSSSFSSSSCAAAAAALAADVRFKTQRPWWDDTLRTFTDSFGVFKCRLNRLDFFFQSMVKPSRDPSIKDPKKAHPEKDPKRCRCEELRSVTSGNISPSSTSFKNIVINKSTSSVGAWPFAPFLSGSFWYLLQQKTSRWRHNGSKCGWVGGGGEGGRRGPVPRLLQAIIQR